MKKQLKYIAPFVLVGIVLGIIFALIVRAYLEQRVQVEQYRAQEIELILQIDSLHKVVLQKEGHILVMQTAVGGYKDRIAALEKELKRIKEDYAGLLAELEAKTPEEVLEIFDSIVETGERSTLTELGAIIPMVSIEASVRIFYERELLISQKRTLLEIIDQKDGVITTLESIIIEKDGQMQALYAIIETKDNQIRVKDMWVIDMSKEIKKLKVAKSVSDITTAAAVVAFILALIF